MDQDRSISTELFSHIATELFPSIATQMRYALSNIHLAAVAMAPPEEREKDPELDQNAALLDQSYYQLLRLVNNLNAAASLREPELPALQDCDLAELMNSVCNRCVSLADLMQIRLSFVCAVPCLICAVCRDSMEQLLYQLLSNALKFTPAGGAITVELKTAGEWVLLSVADTGTGIEPELLPSLFDRYLHKDLMNPSPHGLGLGLPVCRRIAEGHGGNIFAESKPGTGTKVTLSIPLRRTGNPLVRDVPFDYSGGFNKTLLALSDALPRKAFLQQNQD